MKKVILSLPIAMSFLIGADTAQVENCIETFQRELSEILYAKPADKNLTLEDLTKKMNSALDKECDINVSKIDINKTANDVQIPNNSNDEHVIVLDTTENNGDCIENFQKEIRDILNEDSSSGKEKKVKVIIKGDGNNCTKEQTR